MLIKCIHVEKPEKLPKEVFDELLVEVPALHLVASVVLIQVNIPFPIQFNQQ